jgi:ABC-type antimicrobial peptide transport system permease subunit
MQQHKSSKLHISEEYWYMSSFYGIFLGVLLGFYLLLVLYKMFAAEWCCSSEPEEYEKTSEKQIEVPNIPLFIFMEVFRSILHCADIITDYYYIATVVFYAMWIKAFLVMFLIPPLLIVFVIAFFKEQEETE